MGLSESSAEFGDFSSVAHDLVLYKTDDSVFINSLFEPGQTPAMGIERRDYVLFSVIVHGDAEGAGEVRRSVSDWLRAMDLHPAGNLAEIDRYIGYWKPYATSHEELDRDTDVQDEVRNAAWTLLEAVKAKRAGQWTQAGERLEEPRQK